MTIRFAAVSGLVLAGALSAFPAAAQDGALGAEIYQERCAVCHGENGAGDGVVGQLFARTPKDLRQLTNDNDGVFPFVQVYKSIDGRADITGHGPANMPVWGEFFMEQAVYDPRINEKDAKYVTAGRILSVIRFLETIQAE